MTSLAHWTTPTPESPPCLRVLHRALKQNSIIAGYDYATLTTIDQSNNQTNNPSNNQTNDQSNNQSNNQSSNQIFDQWPAARTVWIRGIYRDSMFITCDRRSAKVSQLLGKPIDQSINQSNNPPNNQSICELLWYLPMSKEQFRFHCTATIIGNADDEWINQSNNQSINQSVQNWRDKRSQIWASSPDWLQASMADGYPVPGAVLQSTSHSVTQSINQTNSQSINQSNKQSNNQTKNQPPRNFLLLVFSPIRCDYLRLPITVIDNSKPLHRESLLKPQKHQQRWLYRMIDHPNNQSNDQSNNQSNNQSNDQVISGWTVTQLNP